MTANWYTCMSNNLIWPHLSAGLHGPEFELNGLSVGLVDMPHEASVQQDRVLEVQEGTGWAAGGRGHGLHAEGEKRVV